jgi:hypothetical protein
VRGRITNALKLLFTPLAFAFLLYFGWQSRVELAELISSASLPSLCFAAIVWASLHAVSPIFAATVLSACGSKVSWSQAFATHAARLPARYLPGGIWHTVGRVLDYRELGVSARHLSAFVILENGLAAAVTLAIGGAIVFSIRGTDSLAYLAGLTSLASLLAIPIIVLFLNARILQQPDRLSAQALLKSILVLIVFWAGATFAFLLYLHAFPTSTGAYSNIEMGGIYLFSWGVGFLAIFAPQGIGVFELVASELMDSPIGFMGLAALIAGFRVVVLVADVLVWLIYQGTRQKH